MQAVYGLFMEVITPPSLRPHHACKTLAPGTALLTARKQAMGHPPGSLLSIMLVQGGDAGTS
eukprot:1159745-Pelagomonas_calceolata.AAC.2